MALQRGTSGLKTILSESEEEQHVKVDIPPTIPPPPSQPPHPLVGGSDLRSFNQTYRSRSIHSKQERSSITKGVLKGARRFFRKEESFKEVWFNNDIAEAANISKSQHINRDNILDDGWIKFIDNMISCDNDGCKKRIKGNWFRSILRVGTVKNYFMEEQESFKCQVCKYTNFCEDCARKLNTLNPKCSNCSYELKNVLQNDTELMRAIRLQEREIVMNIIKDSGDKGTDLNKSDITGFTPIFMSIHYVPDCFDIVKELIDKGANFCITDENGMTPLMLAIQRVSTDVADLFLKQKSLTLENINQVDNSKKYTAMKLAVDNKMDYIVETLRRQGCNHSYLTSATWRYAKDKSECIENIFTHGGNFFYDEKGQILPIPAECFKNFLDCQVVKGPDSTDSVVFDYSKLVTGVEELQVEKKDQNQSSAMNKREELKLIKDLVNISTEHRKLAKHPLIEGLVMMKWKKIQVFWYVYMGVKFIFMVMFISLGIGTLGLKQLSCNYTDIDTESSNGKNAVL